MNNSDTKNNIVIHNASKKQWLYFKNPQQIIQAHSIEEIVAKLQEVESLVNNQKLYAAGFISYEAAPAFDKALKTHKLKSFPLLWFGLYTSQEIINLPDPPSNKNNKIYNWTPSISRTSYDQNIFKIKKLLEQGDTYQVNYTFRLRTPFSDDPWIFFLELVKVQQPDYAAYVDTGDYTVCSVSPELFFCVDDNNITLRPMKGTAARGRTLTEDKNQAEWLYYSEKNRSENLMIVDMIRNDIGRVAITGSVKVPSLFDVEKYPTIFQMTSTVTARTQASLSSIIASLFPCASITGAPKPRTMQIIRDLETTPRRIYTGSIGFIAPNRKTQFNIAIRTVLIDRNKGQAEYGVGGGIMWDSISSDEYTECQIKSRVLTERKPDFSLLETMLWTPNEGYFLLNYHLKRLKDSADYFSFSIDIDKIQEKLYDLTLSIPKIPHKIRLLLSKNGDITCETTPLDNTTHSLPVNLKIAETPVNSNNTFLYHKTTNRKVYNDALAALPDCRDVLLRNERNEITETSIANIVVQLNGELITPPVCCGLLPGTFRTWLLDQGKIKEEVVTVETLRQSKNIYLINSVRKWRKAVIK